MMENIVRADDTVHGAIARLAEDLKENWRERERERERES
jgi:hypothetical protein